ncbi:outer-membrane lipoprotein carrier protein precursor [bacterium BMS3Abin04]|nr:outer-membrane lipoprotein carrier protein precursor [bacterium BMS3Abin04]
MLKNLILLFLSLTISILAQTPQELVSEVQKKFDTVEDLSANITTFSNGVKKIEGKFYYKKPDMFRIDGKEMSIVNDGKTVWNYNKKLKRVVINYTSDNPSIFSLKKIITDYPSKCKIENVTPDKSKGNNLIKLVPLQNKLNFRYAVLRITKEKLIDRLEIVTVNGNKIIFKFKNIRINQKLSQKLFSLKPEKGIKIIDLR